MTRRQIKSVLVGFLAMVLSVLALAVILVTVLVISKRELAIGPGYLLVPAVAFVAGCYWSLRRSSRPQVPVKPPSMVTIIVKSFVAGVSTVIFSVIAYMWWIWVRLPRDTYGLVGIDVHRLIYWPVLSCVFLAGFISEYRRASKRRSTFTGGVTP
jgi:hypothetical protein